VASPRPSRGSGQAGKVLLVEPWFTGSHRAWAEGFQHYSRHDVALLTRRPGGWRTTIEKSARELATAVDSIPEVLVASSMMDLVEFQHLSGLRNVPTLVYLHENQLTYDRSKPDLARGAINWRSVATAERIAFNSVFHLEDFFRALPALGMSASALAGARDRSLVLAVGIDPNLLAGPDVRDEGPPVVLWNHRWEADKDPGAFVEAVVEIADVPFRLILAGEGPRADGYAALLLERFGDRVLHAGFAPADLYPHLLRRSDVVVSTAHQEFFGVSIAEAMTCRAVPLVPNRLVYPELLGPELAQCLYEPGTLAERLRMMLTDHASRETRRPMAERAGRRFDWRQVAPRYDEVIDSMM